MRYLSQGWLSKFLKVIIIRWRHVSFTSAKQSRCGRSRDEPELRDGHINEPGILLFFTETTAAAVALHNERRSTCPSRCVPANIFRACLLQRCLLCGCARSITSFFEGSVAATDDGRQLVMCIFASLRSGVSSEWRYDADGNRRLT